MVSSNNKIVSSRFFEQSQFEQMIMTQKWMIINLQISTNLNSAWQSWQKSRNDEVLIEKSQI